jgi:hypothetical protein
VRTNFRLGSSVSSEHEPARFRPKEHERAAGRGGLSKLVLSGDEINHGAGYRSRRRSMRRDLRLATSRFARLIVVETCFRVGTRIARLPRLLRHWPP